MRPPLLDRIKARLCQWFGHRLDDDGYSISCHRCRRLLAGPLNRHEWEARP